MMFTLDKKPCTLVHVNARSEIHGEDRKLAMDLKIAVVLSHRQLDEFHPRLRDAMYTKDGGAQGNLLKDDPAVHPTFPQLDSIKWSEKFEGYKANVTTTYGSLDVDIISAIVDKFLFVPKDGGSVQVTFRIRAQSDGETIGALCEHIQQDIQLSLTPPPATGETSKPREFNPQDDFVADEAAQNAANAAAITLAMETGASVTTEGGAVTVVHTDGTETLAHEVVPFGNIEPTKDYDRKPALLIRNAEEKYELDHLVDLLAQRGFEGHTEEELNTMPDGDYDATLDYLSGKADEIPRWLLTVKKKAPKPNKAKARTID